MLSKELLGLCHFSGTNMCSFENGYVPVYAKFSVNWNIVIFRYEKRKLVCTWKMAMFQLTLNLASTWSLDLVIFQVKTSEHLKNDYVPVYAKFSENWKMKTEKTEIRWYFLKDVVSTWILVTKIVGGSYGKTAEIVKRTFSWLKNAKSQAPLEHF